MVIENILHFNKYHIDFDISLQILYEYAIIRSVIGDILVGNPLVLSKGSIFMQKWKKPYAQLHRRSIFFRFFVGVVLVSTVSVVFLAVLIFQWFQSNTFNDIKKIKNQELQLLGNTFSEYISQCEDFTMTLYMNTNLRSVMLSSSNEWSSSYSHAVQQVQTILSIHPYINSIYVINADKVVFRVTNVAENDASQEALLNYIQTDTHVGTPHLWEMQSIDGRSIPILTVYFREGINSNGKHNGAVAINLDLNKLQDIIFSGQNFSGQEIRVIDQDGQTVLGSSHSPFTEKSYADDILGNDLEEGAFQHVTNGKNVFVSWTSVDDDAFLIVSETEFESGFETLIAGRNFLLCLCAGILLIILVVSFVVSHIVYHPVANVYKNIRTLFPSSSAEESNSSEVLVMTKILKNVSQQMASLEDQRRTDDVIKLLRGMSSALPSDYLVQSGIFTSMDVPYVLVVLRVDCSGNVSESDSKQAASFQITSICTVFAQSVKNYAECTSFRTEKDTIVLLLPQRSTQTPFQQSEIIQQLKILQKTARNEFGLKITAGISDITIGAEQIGETYSAVLDQTRRKVFYEEEQIFALPAKVSEPDLSALDREISAMLQTVKTEVNQTFTLHLQALLDLCCSMSYQSALQRLTQAALSIEHILESAAGLPISEANSLSIYNTLSGIFNYDELVVWFTNLAKQTHSSLIDANHRSAYDTIARAIEILAKQYSDPQISVNSVAEQLAMSTGYFSRIFNEVTGSSFPDYVNNLRLEKAQELLKSHKNMTIREITHSVGYSSESYFSASFKKKYGLSPSKYRLNIENS